jgi:hypothetical protein
MARKRKEVEPAATATDEVVDADAAPEAQPVELEAVAPVSVEEQQVAPVPTKWMVLEEATVSLFGQITTLPAGSYVSVRSYGEEGIRRIMRQGVLLAPVE